MAGKYRALLRGAVPGSAGSLQGVFSGSTHGKGRGPRRGAGVRGGALCRGNSQSGQQHSMPSRGRQKCFFGPGAKPMAQDEQSHTSAVRGMFVPSPRGSITHDDS